MTLQTMSDGSINGAYYYVSQGPKNRIFLVGKLSGSDFEINEYVQKGDNTGSFTGSIVDGVYEGEFVTGSNQYSFSLDRSNEKEIDISDIDFQQFNIGFPWELLQ